MNREVAESTTSGQMDQMREQDQQRKAKRLAQCRDAMNAIRPLYCYLEDSSGGFGPGWTNNTLELQDALRGAYGEICKLELEITGAM